MTRSRRQSKRKIPQSAPKALAAKAALTKERPLLQQAIIDAGAAPDLAMAQATAHPVDLSRYTARERVQAAMALDFNSTASDALTFIEATGFPGFPTLALLGQLAEYRTMHETLADECVRTWGKATSAGDADPAKLADIEAELRRIDLRAHVRQAIINDQAFGGAHVYFKLKGDEEFRDTPLVMKPMTVRKGSFIGLRVVEPYWVTPNNYNSTDPTAADFYKPSTWWMLSMEVHSTRLQTLISRPVADMLKPTYSFRGVSMTQLATPYVSNWLRTRQAVSDTVKQFSVSGIATDLESSLQPGAATSLNQRAQLINAYRDNRNLLFLDKATEEFFQINTPLSGLDALQAQSQEQMSAVSHIPLVKLLGITPSGLNASSEGEIRVFYDYVRGYQTNVLGSLMRNVLTIVQLSLFGEVDDDISWQWEPLEELSALEDADRRGKDATADQIYMENQVVTPEQVAEKLAADPRSGYAGILDAKPGEPADDDIAGITAEILAIGEPDLLAAPADDNIAGIASEILDIGEPSAPEPADNDLAAISAGILKIGMDAEFKEGDHPRADNGQFGSGGGSSSAKKAKLTASEKSAVSSYSGDNFLRMNAALREGDTTDPEVARIDSAIKKSALPTATTLYRGMTREAAKALFPGGNIQAGAVVSDPAYLSTSKDKGEAGARGLGGVVLHIEAAADARALDVGTLSRNPNESEVLLPRNAKLVVKGVTPPARVGAPVIVRVSYE